MNFAIGGRFTHDLMEVGMIQAILFDLDGTLLDRDASVHVFIARQYDRLYEVVGHIPQETYVSRFIELDCRGYVWKDKVYAQLVRDFNIQGITWETLLQDYLDHFKDSCVPFPNLHKMLTELNKSNVKLGLITNGYGKFQMANIQALGIQKYFDTILVSEWEGIKKPHPSIFNRALKQLNVKAHRSIFIGDHPENDIKGAKAVGMKTVWKKDHQWQQGNADVTIDDLFEIPDIVAGMNKGII